MVGFALLIFCFRRGSVPLAVRLNTLDGLIGAITILQMKKAIKTRFLPRSVVILILRRTPAAVARTRCHYDDALVKK